ncbi:lysine N(6)-hydroxylase/L-ornithine N(5)-oxygenase family protein [Bacillus sp. FJAT-44742]|uniref:lysine N(6)-hydroxylase/L-ornithine N(5)-oxygenase family protein n=1 Tax=Bacillus sp. FJAT-44742 TaxID=2014005 RepID=UPI001E57C88C|nr:SidA/IucD/PvdA family monooxygenase [Bacillus sp. FJAT-44742]
MKYIQGGGIRMDAGKLYDVIGIGIGPSNLGLAALLDPIEEIDSLFFEQNTSFEWHPGMLIDKSVLNSSFLSDLVTFADPTNPYSFLNYLHKHNRMYQFFFYQKFNIPRKEYNSYAKWVASQLGDCKFGRQVTNVEDGTGDWYEVTVFNIETGENHSYRARHVVIGTGSTPMIPEDIKDEMNEDICHTSSYLYNEKNIKRGSHVSVIGSGQSAAEVFYDLLQDQKHYGYKLSWLTRSPQFFQTEDAKVGREIFSPDFVDYFQSLSFDSRTSALPYLDQARKQIEPGVLENIYNELYHRSIERKDPDVLLQPMTELRGIRSLSVGTYELTMHQWQKNMSYSHVTSKVIVATGYKPNVPKWLKKYNDKIYREDENTMVVGKDYELLFKKERPNHLFTLTNLDQSHGTGATNLALSVYRNQRIINKIAGYERYAIQEDTIFQQFMPDEK